MTTSRVQSPRGLARCAALILALLAAPALAGTPALRGIKPHGVQRGTEATLTFVGERLGDAEGLFLYRPGIEVVKVEPVIDKAEKAGKSDKAFKVTLRVASDCPLGEHQVRVRTRTGVSELSTFHVGQFPIIDEAEPNGDFAAPQKIPMNVTVHGVVIAEDVDYYVVQARKGDRLSVEVEGMRLGVGMFDPFVAILDMKRFELAGADDTALLLQDPCASIIVPEDGSYVIQVREASYGGNGNCFYRLHVGGFPRPTITFPLGGQANEDLAVAFLGDAKGAIERKIKLPATAQARHPVHLNDGFETPSPNYLRVSPYPNAFEKEPNNEMGQATVVDVPVPVALNGVIGEKGDADFYRFKASKGQVFDVKVLARTLRSPLDAVLTIYDGKGASIATNDDQGGPDPMVKFTVPADGEYVLRVRDHLKGGSPLHVYRVEFNAPTPSLHTHIPEFERAPRHQARQWVVVPRGNRFVNWVRVNRDNVAGDQALSFEGLPAGMKADCDTVTADTDRVPVVFEAAADAPVAGSLAQFTARNLNPQQPLVGGFQQKVDLVLGNPNNTSYFNTTVDRVAVAVTEEVPFKITLVEPKAPLVRNGSMNLRIVAERKEGFKAPIRLAMFWRPPGVTAAGEATIPEGQNEVAYPLNAAGTAPEKAWRIAVLGSADTGNGPVWVSTQLATLKVASQYVEAKFAMTAAEQGQSTELVCTLTQLKPFAGKAKVMLLGLPSRVVADAAEREITKDDTQLVFKLAVDAQAPAGQHKSVFCQILVPEAGEQVAHNTGAGAVIRIDPPAPPKKTAPQVAQAAPKPGPAATPAPAPQPTAAKPLSRLEKLRLEAAAAKEPEKK